jgi:1,2-diacylglycerol 3-alpha-glucosyltransferase
MRKATAGRKACWLVLSRAKLLCVSEFRLLCMRESVLDRRNGRRCYSVAMVPACPFPANHGTPGAIRKMLETLAQLGHTVHIVTYSSGQDDIVVRFAKVHRAGPIRPQRNVKVGPSAEKFLLDFAVLRWLCRLIQSEPIDIIHRHNYKGAVIGALAGWITRRPVLYHAVNLMSDELPGYRFIRPEWLVKRVAGLLDRLIPIFRDHIIALSPELKEWLATNGTPESKVDVVPCGVNPDIFNGAALANLGTSFQIRNRMYTGVPNRFQRMDYLLRGFAIALNQEPDALLLIVSPVISEAHKREHTKLAHKLGISHVIGWIGPHLLEDLPDYLALANVTLISRPDCPVTQSSY